MTRDHKVALIVGFALVLVVGVLISDHMSAAQEAEMDAAIGSGGNTGDGEVARGAPAAPLPEADAPADPIDAIAAAPEGTPPGGVLSEALRDREALPERPLSTGGAEQADGDPGITDHLQWLRHQWRQFGESPVAAEVDQARLGADGPAPAERTSVLLHPVQKGESLWTIAEGHYGDGALWRELAAFNDDRVVNGAVRAGVTLRIPPKPVLLGERPAPASAEAATPAPERKKPAREYTIKPGDTLGELSQRFLGTVRRQDEIVEMNRDVIDDPDVLPVGETIKIPGS